VAADLGSGVLLDFGIVESACIRADTQRCLALRWSIDPSVNNVIQSDSVRLDLSLVATDCDTTTNPFGADA
jgi:hypothetical protein